MVKTNNQLLWRLIAILCILVVLTIIWSNRPYKPTPIIIHLKRKLGMIHPKFIYLDIREGKSSYTENKKTIYICTRDPKTKQYYDDNTLIYVCLHECAHVLVPEYDNHGTKFKAMFHHLLKKAITKGLYNPLIPISNTYCGLNNS